MRLLIAPGPYKDCLDASTVADAIEIGVRQVLSQVSIDKLPLCDGGTGIGERFIGARGGRKVMYRVHNPLMQPTDAYFALLGDGTAVVESAQAAGLALVPFDRRDPLATTTYGVGELIGAAVQAGCREIIVGCGDSATNDGGVGMAQALGVQFLDCKGKPIGQGGKELSRLATIDPSSLPSSFDEVSVSVACNMTSILCGENGTTRVYASQKGATSDAIEILDNAVEHYAGILEDLLGYDIRYLPGSGGAGGLAAGLYAFLGAKLRYSMDIVSEVLELEAHVRNADLVITGEGMTDAKTASGKAPCAVGLIAKKYNIPTMAIVGSLGPDVDIVFFHGLDMVEPILTHPMTLEEALDPERAKGNIVEATIRAMRFVKRGAGSFTHGGGL